MVTRIRPRSLGTPGRSAPAGGEFAVHCTELLAPLGPVRIRRMFGGQGIYLDDLFIAIIADDCLYLKADAETQQVFRAAGCRAFSYDAAGQRMTMGYWTVPEDAMEASPQMAPWARLALAAALRARAMQKPRAAGVRQPAATPPRRTGKPQSPR